MTNLNFVIPVYFISLIHIYTHRNSYIHDFIVSTSIFQVFSIKTCWLLDSSVVCLLVSFIFTKSGRYSAKISRISNPLLGFWTDLVRSFAWISTLFSVVLKSSTFQSPCLSLGLSLVEVKVNWGFDFFEVFL